MPAPDASAPTRCRVQGREAVLVGARAGIQLRAGPRAPLARQISDGGRAMDPGLFLLECRARSRLPDGSDAASLLSCGRGGGGDSVVVGIFQGNIEQRAGPGLVAVQE
jgi:hypothetical protein